jgi:porphobilinogen deaminase
LLAALDAPATRSAVTLERAALALAEGGCDTAFGAYAQTTAGGFELTVMTERDGQILASRVAGKLSDAGELARRAFAALQPVIGGSA